MLMGWIVLPAAVFLYLRFGYVPVAVNGPVIPLEQMLAGAAIEAKIAREAPTKEGLPATEENLLAGAKIYREQCVECHGLPGGAKSVAARFPFGQRGGRVELRRNRNSRARSRGSRVASCHSIWRMRRR